MFNIGPLEMVVLAAVALILFGPDKLPQLAKDAARMLRTLRDLAQGARTQLNNELGPEFTNFDLNSLNPRTALRNALLGDEDFSSLNPKDMLARAMRGEDDPEHPAAGRHPMDEAAPQDRAASAQPQQPLQPGQAAPWDADAT